MMMNFLDLSASSEEERRIIREILSDTSVVNIAEPQTTSTQSLVPNAQTTVQQLDTSNIISANAIAQQSYQHHAKQGQKPTHQHSTRDYRQHNQQQHSSSTISPAVASGVSHVTPNNNHPENLKSAIKSQTAALTAATPTAPTTNAHLSSSPSPQNGSDFVGVDTTPALIVNNSEDATKVVQASTSIAGETTNAPTSIVHNGQQQQPMHHQQINGQRQSFKNNNNNPNQHVNHSNNANNNNNANINAHTNSSPPMSGNIAPQNHRNNYSNSQRKNIHNSNNINSIGNSNNSGSNRNNNSRLPSLGTVTNSGVQQQQQQHYSQQYAPQQHPSNASSSTHYHNINVNNINNHSANALNSQLNQQHRTNEHSNDRLRSGLNNHISSNNDINTSSSGLATLAPTSLDQHHGNTMPLNVYNHHTAHVHHQGPPIMSTAKIDPKSGNMKNQAYHSQDTSTSIQNTTTGAQSVPSSAQMPPMAGDMNSVIGMDMTSTQPPGYAIPPHVTAFGPPHHVYGGPPIFHQPYHTHYLIPYNIPSYVPYVLPPNSVVPTRQQVPPQSNQSPNTITTASSHSRSHSHHIPQQQQNHEHYGNVNNVQSQLQSSKDDNDPNKEMTHSQQGQNPKKNESEKEIADIRSSSTIKTTAISPQNDNRSLLQKSEKTKISPKDTDSSLENELPIEVKSSSQEQNVTRIDKSTKVVSSNVKVTNVTKTGTVASKNKNVVPITRGDRTENQLQKAETDYATGNPSLNKIQLPNRNMQSDNNRDSIKQQDVQISSKTVKTSGEDLVKLSSDEGFDTQSSLDISKQSHESPIPASDKSKSSPENCNKVVLEKTPLELSESNDIKSNEVPQRIGGRAWGSASSKSWADLFKRGGNSALLTSSGNGETEHNISGSENSDEENKNQRSASIKLESSVKVNSLVGTSKEHRSQEAAKRALDKMAPRLAQKINSITLKHALPFLKPRGFINKGNGCYINATLQALIACPPFYNLMKEIGDLRISRRENSCTPILDSFAELFLNFPPLDANKQKNKQSTSQDQKLHINYLQAEAIEPKCIYNVLGQIKSECLKGAQEDAEEFLSSVLNGLHEEMIGLSEILQTSQDLSAHNGHPSDVEDSNDDIANDDNLWREVGPKNRSLPIRTAKVINTPIQEIFGGSLFSIRTAGKDRCGHRSPFIDLQLDISGDNVKSVQDAIKSFTATEIIHDFYCSKTKQKLDAQRRTSLDQLPPILILHLKQFVYTQDHGLKKLMKKIEYPIDFELPENCLHEKNSTDKNLRTSRSYKLLAVVYHDGKEAIKGHYLTDVYHIGSSQWIRCDDSNLKVIPSPRIENPDSSRTPYLLFYRRLNTLRAQIGNHDNKKKS